MQIRYGLMMISPLFLIMCSCGPYGAPAKYTKYRERTGFCSSLSTNDFMANMKTCLLNRHYRFIGECPQYNAVLDAYDYSAKKDGVIVRVRVYCRLWPDYDYSLKLETNNQNADCLNKICSLLEKIFCDIETESSRKDEEPKRGHPVGSKKSSVTENSE